MLTGWIPPAEVGGVVGLGAGDLRALAVYNRTIVLFMVGASLIRRYWSVT